MTTTINWAANPDGSKGETVNPVRGMCTPISAGCAHCYARAQVPRMRRFGAPGYETDEPTFHPNVLAQVLRWKKPRTIFWDSMFDLFEERVPDEWIAACFGVMAATPHHVHVVLTKRAARMRAWFGAVSDAAKRCGLEKKAAGHWPWVVTEPMILHAEAQKAGLDVGLCDVMRWPLRNVVLMVTAEDQANADSRIPDLLACPAATYGVSCEPLLEGLDLRPWLPHAFIPGPADCGWELQCSHDAPDGLSHCGYWESEHPQPVPALDWVICGCESGPHRRPMDPDWARDLRDQCVAAKVPFFLKQGPGDHGDALRELPLLDGRTWAQRPAVFGGGE